MAKQSILFKNPILNLYNFKRSKQFKRTGLDL